MYSYNHNWDIAVHTYKTYILWKFFTKVIYVLKRKKACGKIRTQSGTESIWHAKIIKWKVLNYFLLFEKFSVGKAFCWELWDQRGTKKSNHPIKHFGTKVRTMVRFFVPLWSQSTQQKAFPTVNFSKSKK